MAVPVVVRVAKHADGVALPCQVLCCCAALRVATHAICDYNENCRLAGTNSAGCNPADLVNLALVCPAFRGIPGILATPGTFLSTRDHW
jgi:hypothetical protein